MTTALYRTASSHFRTPIFAAAFAAASLGGACSPTSLPERGARVETLVRLDGAPTAPLPNRLRIVVANAHLGLDGEDIAAPGDVGERVNEGIERLGERFAAYSPDVVVAFDVPLGGEPFRVTGRQDRSQWGTEWDVLDPPEMLAVAADRYHRIEWVRQRGTQDDWAAPLGPIARGTVVLAETDMAILHATTDSLQATIGGTDGLALAINTEGHGIQVHQAPCQSDVQTPDGGFCIVVPDTFEVLRTATTPIEGAYGDAIRLELKRRADGSLAAPDDNP